MSLAASESQLSLWALGSAPLILGGDLTSAVTNAYGTSAGLDPTDFSLLTNRQVIKVDQDSIDAKRIVNSGNDQVFAKTEKDGDVIVGLFNYSGSATTTDHMPTPPMVEISTVAARRSHAAPESGRGLLPRFAVIGAFMGRHSAKVNIAVNPG